MQIFIRQNCSCNSEPSENTLGNEKLLLSFLTPGLSQLLFAHKAVSMERPAFVLIFVNICHIDFNQGTQKAF